MFLGVPILKHFRVPYGMCKKGRLRSACIFVQSDQSFPFSLHNDCALWNLKQRKQKVKAVI